MGYFANRIYDTIIHNQRNINDVTWKKKKNKMFRKRFELTCILSIDGNSYTQAKRKKKKEVNCSIGKNLIKLRSILRQTKPYVRKRLVDRIVRPNCLFDLIPLVMQPTSVSLFRAVSCLFEYSVFVIGRNSSVIS